MDSKTAGAAIEATVTIVATEAIEAIETNLHVNFLLKLFYYYCINS